MEQTDPDYILIMWLEEKERWANRLKEKYDYEKDRDDWYHALGMWGAFKEVKEMLQAAKGSCENETVQWNRWTTIMNAIRTEMAREEMRREITKEVVKEALE